MSCPLLSITYFTSREAQTQFNLSYHMKHCLTPPVDSTISEICCNRAETIWSSGWGSSRADLYDWFPSFRGNDWFSDQNKKKYSESNYQSKQVEMREEGKWLCTLAARLNCCAENLLRFHKRLQIINTFLRPANTFQHHRNITLFHIQ